MVQHENDSDQPRDRPDGQPGSRPVSPESQASDDIAPDAEGPGEHAASETPDHESPSSAGFERDEVLQQLSRASVVHLYMQERRVYGGVYVEGSVQGDIAGQDLRKTSSSNSVGDPRGSRISVVPLPPEDRRRLRAVVEPVADHDRARQILDRHRLAFIYGPSGTGKETAAAAALGLEKEIFIVTSAVTTSDLVAFGERFSYGRECCYLVPSLAPATAERLDASIVGSLQRQLADQESQLVVTIDDPANLDRGVAHLLVSWREGPDPLVALRSHIAFYLQDEDRESYVESRYGLAALVQELASRGVRSVDEAARAICDANKCDEGSEHVRIRLGLDARRRLETWFEPSRTLAQLAFLLASSVLSGRPYTVVDAHAERLERLLARLTRIDLSRHHVDPRRRRRQRLEDAFARLGRGLVETEFGPCPADLVEMGDQALRGELLRLVWSEYDVLGEALLRWLRSAGRDRDPLVRLQAAAAAGWLAQLDFATVRERLFLPWARGNRSEAFCAAEALGFAANFSADGTAGLALRLLAVWSGEQGDRTDIARWFTAALAYGGGVGIRYPEVAVPGLRRILLNDDPRSLARVVDCLVSLLRAAAGADPAVATVVLQYLAGWLDLDRRSSDAARWTLTRVLTGTADITAENNGRLGAILFTNANAPSVAVLLRSALSDRATRNLALQALRDLLGCIDLGAPGGHELCVLLGQVAHGPGAVPKDADRLTFYLERWSVGLEPSRTAAEALAAVKGATP